MRQSTKSPAAPPRARGKKLLGLTAVALLIAAIAVPLLFRLPGALPDPEKCEFCWNCSSFMPNLLVEYAKGHDGWYPRGGRDPWESLGLAIKGPMDVHFFSCHELAGLAGQKWAETGVLGREGCCYSYVEGLRLDDPAGPILAYFDPPGVPPKPTRLCLFHDPGEWLHWEERQEAEFQFELKKTEALIARRSDPKATVPEQWGTLMLAELEANGFFTWGFQKRVEEHIRKGAARCDDARRNSLGMTLVPIPGGTFAMGLDGEDATAMRKSGEVERYIANRLPRHQVTVAPFLAAFEPVTLEQWNVYRTDTVAPQASSWQLAGGHAMGISWRDATAFCAWLTERERAAGLIDESRVYRLPTEAEWEWMASSGTGGRYPHGEVFVDKNERVMSPYGLVNAFGVLAWVHAYEHCLDVYDAEFYARSPGDDPVCLGSAGDRGRRVLRGGNLGTWSGTSGRPPYVSWRFSGDEHSSAANIGFRVVLGEKR